jgi:hypothetical protein
VQSRKESGRAGGVIRGVGVILLESGKDAAVAGGKGRLVQWISRELSKEGWKKKLALRERSPARERDRRVEGKSYLSGLLPYLCDKGALRTMTPHSRSSGFYCQQGRKEEG